MSEYESRYKTPNKYNSKTVREGLPDKVKELKAEGKTFEQIGSIIGKSKARASQIYYKAVAKGY